MTLQRRQRSLFHEGSSFHFRIYAVFKVKTVSLSYCFHAGEKFTLLWLLAQSPNLWRWTQPIVTGKYSARPCKSIEGSSAYLVKLFVDFIPCMPDGLVSSCMVHHRLARTFWNKLTFFDLGIQGCLNLSSFGFSRLLGGFNTGLHCSSSRRGWEVVVQQESSGTCPDGSMVNLSYVGAIIC